VAYVSYNTYPGWHARGAVRDMMRFHARHLTDPPTATAAARDLLVFLLESAPAGAYRGLLEEEQERLSRVRDTYIYHEHLEDANEPVYFSEFVRRAARHGLQFLSEADLGAALAPRLSAPMAAALRRLSDDPMTREQYLDFLTNRMFRQTLLCRADVPLQREPQPERLSGLHVAACLEEVASAAEIPSTLPHEFRGPNKITFSTGHPITKAALACLAEAWPRSLSFAALQAAARARLVGDAVVTQEAAEYARDTHVLADNLLQGFAAGVVDLHARAAPLVAEPGERPHALTFARHQAQEGAWVTNGWHQLVNLDPLTCRLLHHLDGSRDRAALLEVLVHAVTQEHVPLERYHQPVTGPERVRGILRRELEANLQRLGRCALLVA
jgi:methyltransferase-like protein